jgi:hypothetical protein
MKRIRFLTIPLLAVLLGIAILLPLSAGAASTQPSTPSAASTVTNTFKNIPVSGHFKGGGTFQGTLTVTQFVAQSGKVAAQGLLSGTLTNKAGNVVGTVTNQLVTLPVRLDPTCSILNLVVGPIDLNLLGLMVHVSQITITITANPAGGVLGQLLCDIANLLNSGSPLSQILSQILADLNQILGMLP